MHGQDLSPWCGVKVLLPVELADDQIRPDKWEDAGLRHLHNAATLDSRVSR